MRSIDAPWDMDTHYCIHPNGDEFDALLNGLKCKIFIRKDYSDFGLIECLAAYFIDGEINIEFKGSFIRFWFHKGTLHRKEAPAVLIEHYAGISLYYRENGKNIESYHKDRRGCYAFKKTSFKNEKMINIDESEFNTHYDSI